MVKTEIAQKAADIKQTVDELDRLLDGLTSREATNLLEVYKSINIILKAQPSVTPSLSVVD